MTSRSFVNMRWRERSTAYSRRRLTNNTMNSAIRRTSRSIRFCRNSPAQSKFPRGARRQVRTGSDADKLLASLLCASSRTMATFRSTNADLTKTACSLTVAGAVQYNCEVLLVASASLTGLRLGTAAATCVSYMYICCGSSSALYVDHDSTVNGLLDRLLRVRFIKLHNCWVVS
jgi:hypothetical protein